MKRTTRGLLAIAGVVTLAVMVVIAQSPSVKPIDPAQAILDEYALALNSRKASAYEPYFADSIDHIDDEGKLTSGRANVLAMYTSAIDGNDQFQVKMTVTTSKKIGNDGYLIEGNVELRNGDAVDRSLFESIWQKSGDRWQLCRVRELSEPEAESVSNADKLNSLAWLVGEWTSESGDYRIKLSMKWGKNKNFLIGEQVVSQNGTELVTINKIIGWDAVDQQIRSWVFDSDGGFGSSSMSSDGKVCIEATQSQTRSGSQASATLTMEQINATSFVWKATDRKLDEADLADLKLTYTRQTSK